MNEAQLTERILNRLSRQADGDAWIPVLGWTGADGRPLGLAVELLEPDPSKARLRKLGRCVARLVWDEQVELRISKRSRGVAPVLSGTPRPVESPYVLIGPGSNTIAAAASIGEEYVVRLRRG